MLKVGITGGIGSGKTIVCQLFETLGIPVFYADAAARFLMENNDTLMEQIKLLFGNDVYDGKKLQREKLAALTFHDPEKLKALNGIVHPATIQYGKEWMKQQKAVYAIKEAAILFESGSHKELDAVIGVYAPKALRIQRTMQRDRVTREQVEERIARQMSEEKKMSLCDYVITNDDQTAIIPQVLELHKKFIK